MRDVAEERARLVELGRNERLRGIYLAPGFVVGDPDRLEWYLRGQSNAEYEIRKRRKKRNK